MPLDILENPDATNGLIGEARNNLKAMNENIERLNNANDDLRKAKRAKEDRDIAEEEAGQLRDEYLKDLDEKKDKDLIKEIKSIKLDDPESFKRVFDRISEHDDKYKQSMAELQHLRDLRKIAQEDKANQDVWIAEMKALGREHPHYAAKVAELETKWRKSGGLENALLSLLGAERRAFSTAKKKRELILKEYSAFGDQVSQFMKQEEEYNDKMKEYLRDNYYLGDKDKEKVNYNNLEENLKLVKAVHKDALWDKQHWLDKCKEKFEKTRDLEDRAEEYGQYSEELDKYIRTIKERIEDIEENVSHDPYYNGEDDDDDDEDY